MKSLKELRELHESGMHVRRDVQRRINAQLKRTCAYKDCDVSLAFRSAKVEYCSKNHRARGKYATKAANKAKKERYYKKHGIVFNKTIRNRDAKPSPLGRGVEYSDQNLLYENYKEPLKQIEKGKGYGYYGTLALTEDGEYVQCHICGNLFPNVGMHLRKHKIAARDYKEKYGLALETGLVSEPERRRLQELVVSKSPISISGGLPIWLQEDAYPLTTK